MSLAANIVRVAGGLAADRTDTPIGPTDRVTRIVRMIERCAEAKLTLTALARHAGLSPYHFLLTFARATGVTPRRYILRMRLRNAAVALASDRTRSILDIALACGFGDLSNFNRAFRSEFGAAPRVYRSRLCRRGSG